MEELITMLSTDILAMLIKDSFHLPISTTHNLNSAWIFDVRKQVPFYKLLFAYYYNSIVWIIYLMV